METTLVLIKPDGVERNLVGEIITRFERRDLFLASIKSLVATRAMIDAHYAHLLNSEHYPRILGWMTRGILVAATFTGDNAIAVAKQTIGATDPLKAAPGTIRADFANKIGSNLVHASADANDAQRELAIWFPIESQN